MKRSTFLKSLLALSVVPFIGEKKKTDAEIMADYKMRLEGYTKGYSAANGEKGEYIEFDGVGYFPEDHEYRKVRPPQRPKNMAEAYEFLRENIEDDLATLFMRGKL